MEEFYKKIRKRSDNKPIIMSGLIAAFYLCMGVGFTGIQYEENLTIVLSCLICVFMASLVYAVVKGKIVKAAVNCAIFFVIGILVKFVIANERLTFFDTVAAFGIFIVLFCIGFAMGKMWYDKYMD